MLKTLKITDLECRLAEGGGKRITYLIYPAVVPVNDDTLEGFARKYDTSIALVGIPADDWNNYLTPWPEPGEAKGFPPFAGDAPQFLKVLKEEIVPEVEKAMELSENAERNLIGVSLSGLFTLWQWLGCDLFHSIACLSGSFWYPGFLPWFEKQVIPHKDGRAFFLLGKDEPNAKIAAYQSVGVNTEAIVSRLKAAGIDVTFEWVPGNHFSAPMHRLAAAFAALQNC